MEIIVVEEGFSLLALRKCKPKASKRYMKQELIAKGALSAWDLPTHVELKPEANKQRRLCPSPTFGPSTNAINLARRCCSQVVGFSSANQTTFYRRRKTSSLSWNHLLQERLLWRLTTTTTRRHFSLNLLRSQNLTRGKIRGRDGTVAAALPAMSLPTAAPPPLAPPVVVQNADRAPLVSTQASRPTVSNLPSPRCSNMDVDSDQTLHAKYFGRGIPILKGLGVSSSSLFQTTLPMFLEHGSFCGLLKNSEKQGFMDPQLFCVVDHIIKVTLYNLSLIISN